MKLGYISDFEICITSGEVAAITVPYKSKKSLISCGKKIRIPWDKISAIGDEIILVNISYE